MSDQTADSTAATLIARSTVNGGWSSKTAAQLGRVDCSQAVSHHGGCVGADVAGIEVRTQGPARLQVPTAYGARWLSPRGVPCASTA
jgi:hypothetical protein